MASIISDQICQELAANVVNGTIPPGHKLEEQVIADQFGVSRTPVREAFRQLAAAGLIDSQPHRGVRVIDLDIDQLSDMFEALAELEAMCAALSAERMTSIERKQLEAIHESIRPLAGEEDVPHYSDLNEKFHDTVRKGAHNETLANPPSAFGSGSHHSGSPGHTGREIAYRYPSQNTRNWLTRFLPVTDSVRTTLHGIT